MTAAIGADWRKDFGVAESKPPRFFSGSDDLVVTTPQGHLLRRAFEILEMDGVLCADHSPLVYFKQLSPLTADDMFLLHKRFWNHGGAPVLVVISDDKVYVFSGMSRPVPGSGPLERMPSLVTTLKRAGAGLRAFLTSVESGEFFRQNPRSFNPEHRVDRALLENLSDTRDDLASATRTKIPADILDAVLCRLVFTCYLFDREVIGQSYLMGLGAGGAAHLKDVLAIEPAVEARTVLYRLFKRLGKNFNGDLFSDDLDEEAEFIDGPHIQTLKEFFHGTTVRTGQRSFWPYDFGVIPIETISAIYERFLKESDEQTGAFYTPRFLAEVVLDTALDGMQSLAGKKFLDPACGSGIFLVGLFNRMAEEWKQQNPTARNPRRARELRRLLLESLYGVDINPTACRISAFSLYLAYLDQLSPRDIQELQELSGEPPLPNLIATEKRAGNIRRADFFDETVAFPDGVDLVIGNPPWGSTATKSTPPGRWCQAHGKPLPDKQIAAAFVWKGAEHVSSEGRVCFVLPHGVLFHHSNTALDFQSAWVRQYAITRVLNLADFRWFLFGKAVHPALVVSYRNNPPPDAQHRIEYWVPKTDWTVIRTEVITIGPADRSTLTVAEIVQDLKGPDAPQVWKQKFWATPRDFRLLDRLTLYPRLRDHVRGPKERNSNKPWIMAVGFQPFGENDPERSRRTLTLPSRCFIPATSPALDLFILEDDCVTLPSNRVEVRRRIQNSEIFQSPHVLVAEGYTSIAYADFDVSFQHALRGIHGPAKDRNLLIFLTAYLRSPLAMYFLFHTSSSWGVARPKVHVEEVLRVPMPLPDQQPNPKRCGQIVEEVAEIVTDAARRASATFMDRAGIVRSADAAITPLIDEYFDMHEIEKPLIEDTLEVTIRSIQPTRRRMPVPTVTPSSPAQRQAYCDRVRGMLNEWAKRGKYKVRGAVHASETMGIGMAVFETVSRSDARSLKSNDGDDMLEALDYLRRAFPQPLSTLDLVRGLLVFDMNRLYVVKPIGRRHWTQTAAMNDADEIAGTILMRPLVGDA
jgi:N-6 DNA Methylase